MIDFKNIISETHRYNFHSHTQFCDGRAAMADFAAAAAEAGFLHWGFSPHSPICLPSPCNMKAGDVDSYIVEVERLQKLYPGGPRFYAAMEIDYLKPGWGPSTPYFQDLPLDYRIGSVHFISNHKGEFIDVDGSYDTFCKRYRDYFRSDIRYIVSAFYDATLNMISRGGFDIIGHFDKIGNNADFVSPGIEQEGWYVDRVDEVVSEITAAGIAVEINTKAYEKCGRFFPNPSLWHKLAASDTTLLVNSDTHIPALHSAGRAEALSLLSAIRNKTLLDGVSC